MENEKDIGLQFVMAKKMFKFKYNQPGSVESDIKLDYTFERPSNTSSFYNESDNMDEAFQKISGPIRQKSVLTKRKFTPFDTSKPFRIPFKSPTTINDNDFSGVQIIDKDQEICSNMETNSTFEIS
ncbi:24082_t:CDS:2 [Dentiscutata erythropus]|uniref:24082_t:CDS:1 n=1 Tax=Dentiscutata erythropus TaxID=1348616 RepID=A0A9N8ZQS2_9GLOM|nr:24082_t:CDS:2 [Dentiscutata erythropus]